MLSRPLAFCSYSLGLLWWTGSFSLFSFSLPLPFLWSSFGSLRPSSEDSTLGERDGGICAMGPHPVRPHSGGWGALGLKPGPRGWGPGPLSDEQTGERVAPFYPLKASTRAGSVSPMMDAILPAMASAAGRSASGFEWM